MIFLQLLRGSLGGLDARVDMRDSICPGYAALLQDLIKDGAARHRDPAVQHDGASE